jgi:hypothetical protein
VAGRRRSTARARGLAAGFALAVHLAFVAALLGVPRTALRYSQDATIDAELIAPLSPRAPPSAPSRPRPDQKPPPLSGRSARGAWPGQAAEPQTPAPAAPRAASLPLDRPPAAGGLGPPELGAALRGALGCGHTELLHMTSAEREACETRTAAAGRSAVGPQFGVDPRKQALFDAAADRAAVLQKPFLSERPKKGCRPIVTEQTFAAPGNAPPDWRLQLACGVQF